MNVMIQSYSVIHTHLDERDSPNGFSTHQIRDQIFQSLYYRDRNFLYLVMHLISRFESSIQKLEFCLILRTLTLPVVNG